MVSHIGEGLQVHPWPHLDLITMTEGGHHAQAPFLHSISNQDSHESGFITESQTGVSDKLHPSLPPNVRGCYTGEKFL